MRKRSLHEESLGDSNKLSEQRDSVEDDEGDKEDGDYEEFEEFKWLKSINIPIKADDAADCPRIGFCEAKLTDRDYIRAAFHRDIEEPSNDTATVGFGVFNQ